MFKKFAKFIQNDLIPAIKKAFEFLMRPGGPFDGLKEALSGIIDFAVNVLQNLTGGKNGGRVTPKGIGKAKRGFGKAMGKK